MDAELVLHTMIQYKYFHQAIIVSGDGDFYCLAEHLLKIGKLKKMLIPNQKQYSGLLKRLSTAGYNILDFMNTLQGKLSYQEKRKGLSSGQTP